MSRSHASLLFAALSWFSAVAHAQAPASAPAGAPEPASSTDPEPEAPASLPPASESIAPETGPAAAPAPAVPPVAAEAIPPNESTEVLAPPAASAAPVPALGAPAPGDPSAPGSASPFDMDVAPDLDWSATPLGGHQQNWFALLGARFGSNPHAGFDPYSEDDLLAQLSVGLGRVVYVNGRFSVAALALWDFAGRSSQARGEETELFVHRFALGPEARYHFLHRFYAFARLTPGAVLALASLENQVAGSTRLEASEWLFSGDAVGGVAFEAFGNPDGARRSARGWVSVEGGYGWSSSADLEFTAPEDAGAPERGAPQSLGDLALRGPLVRVSLLVTAL